MRADVHAMRTGSLKAVPLIPMLVNGNEFTVCDDNSDGQICVIVTLSRDDLVYMLNKIDEELAANERERKNPR